MRIPTRTGLGALAGALAGVLAGLQPAAAEAMADAAVVEALARCRDLDKMRQRVHCYDAVTDSLNNAPATRITRNAIGKYRVELENGQVWQQLQGDTNELLLDEEEDQDVIIKRRSLGYALRLPGSNRSILLKRLK